MSQESTSFCGGYKSLQWHHNEHDGVSNHQPYDCLLNRLVKHRLKTHKRYSDAENVSIWWRQHVTNCYNAKVPFYGHDATQWYQQQSFQVCKSCYTILKKCSIGRCEICSWLYSIFLTATVKTISHKVFSNVLAFWLALIYAWLY